jgi:hypothetical protein
MTAPLGSSTLPVRALLVPLCAHILTMVNTSKKAKAGLANLLSVMGVLRSAVAREGSASI